MSESVPSNLSLIGHLHFRTVDSDRYEIWANTETGDSWYNYAGRRYSVFIPIYPQSASASASASEDDLNSKPGPGHGPGHGPCQGPGQGPGQKRGWRAFMAAKLDGDTVPLNTPAPRQLSGELHAGPVYEPAVPLLAIVISTAFLFDEYMDEIQSSLDSLGMYPAKYWIKRGTSPPQLVINALTETGARLEIAPEYIQHIMAIRESTREATREATRESTN